MRTRIDLQNFLEKMMGNDHVYYQPPATVKMKYPAIKYERSTFVNQYANNITYKQKIAYTLTILDKKPDNPVIAKLSKLPLCRFDRHYTSDGLNHDVFTIFF